MKNNYDVQVTDESPKFQTGVILPFFFFSPVKWWSQGSKATFPDCRCPVYYWLPCLPPLLSLVPTAWLPHSSWPGLQRPQSNQPATWQGTHPDFSTLSPGLGTLLPFLSFLRISWIHSLVPGASVWIAIPSKSHHSFMAGQVCPLPHTLLFTSRSCSSRLLRHVVSTHRSAAHWSSLVSLLLCPLRFLFNL